jgi:transcriptional regulator with XRE-family HTH domain
VPSCGTGAPCAGLSQAQLGARTHDSSHTIGKIEIALRRPSLAIARRLDVVLDTGGVLERLLPLAQSAKPAGTAYDNADLTKDDPGLGWNSAPADIVKAVAGLWRADMHRRAVIATAWAAAALAEPLGRWFLDPADKNVARAGKCRVGQADVDALWSMCAAFADADHQLGGGNARNTLIHYANQVMTPLLDGSYTNTMGRRLFAAASRLCDVAGFMCSTLGAKGSGRSTSSTRCR